MSRGPDAATLLRRALERDVRTQGCAITIGTVHSTRWASATFVGAQHRLTLDAPDDAALARWLGALAEAELTLRGHLVADATVTALARHGGCAEATIEVLTVEA